ncbi:DUF6470 family protein [Aquibacillus albus]|uniref:YviE n=1 Tax=Aquibacillus albus TaxID=1168171 RepID=A0ABS2MWH9_9BACI|nr:DUF6470 family protein [Aquibacillus albus]MBM7570244.1 hypothetical protein [Aquibacillus albus]
MQLPQIRLQSQMANIQINQTPAQQSIQQNNAIQTIKQPKADLDIQRTPSKLTIDQTQAWEDMDLKPISRRIEEAAQLGKQAVLKGIARRARQGDELMKIENNGNPIARQAKENGFDEPKQFNIGWIPSAGAVKIDYQPSSVEVNIQPRKPIIESTVQKPNIDYKPGEVDISLKQRNELHIDFINLDLGGANFETTI